MQRIAVISDIHSNVEALEAVIAAIIERDVDAIYCLGDIVGYGANPVECVDLVRHYCRGVVKGNHDEAVATNTGLKYLPSDGEAAVKHNRALLSDEQLAWLDGLPLKIEEHGVTFVHATPDRPGAWQRLESFVDVRGQFDAFDTDVCFTGHSHVPGVLGERLGVFKVRPGCRFIINAGSVGKPRDRDPRACAALFDRESVSLEMMRIPYNTPAASRKVIEAGLPRRLADALAGGY